MKSNQIKQLQNLKDITSEHSVKNHQNNKVYRIVNKMFIDFTLLANKHPQLYKHLVILGHRVVVNFKNQQSLIILTQAIMKCIFNIQWNCPYNNLCPRIPNRLNYLLWINQFIPIKIQKVLDIGTGATLIYPLLGWSTFKWKFIATQKNPQSYFHAQKLIRLNKLENQIKIVKIQQDDKVFQFELGNNGIQEIDVVICNPPFYEDQQQKGSSQYVVQSNLKDSFEVFENKEKLKTKKSKGPLGTMQKNQFSTVGGEYQFFFEMYRQSFKYVSESQLKKREKYSQALSEKDKSRNFQAKYFSCLFGRQTSFKEVIQFLKYQYQFGVIQEFKQGQIRQGSNTRFIAMWKPTII